MIPFHESAIKLNVDGSIFSHTNNAACGDIFRNLMGSCIMSFACNLRTTSIMYVELWIIIKGLQITVTNELTHHSCDCGIEFANRTCPKKMPSIAPCYFLIQNITVLVCRIFHVRQVHILWEANVCADVMAKKGQQLRIRLYLFDHPISEFYLSLLFDCVETYRLRDSA
ncbi:Putative ribonuclease H protein family [Arachis hypogaea]|nr:Putative ribonuclease H protein family [Arachis hypogaea]